MESAKGVVKGVVNRALAVKEGRRFKILQGFIHSIGLVYTTWTLHQTVMANYFDPGRLDLKTSPPEGRCVLLFERAMTLASQGHTNSLFGYKSMIDKPIRVDLRVCSSLPRSTIFDQLGADSLTNYTYGGCDISDPANAARVIESSTVMGTDAITVEDVLATPPFPHGWMWQYEVYAASNGGPCAVNFKFLCVCLCEG